MAPASSSSSSYEEYTTSSSADEQEVEAQLAPQKLPIPPPARQEPIKRQLRTPPSPQQQGTEGSDEEEDSEEEEDSDESSDSDEAPPGPQAQVHTKPSLPKRVTATAGLDGSSPSNKRVPAAALITTTKPTRPQKAAVESVQRPAENPPIPAPVVPARQDSLPKEVNVPPPDLTKPPSLLRWLAAAGLVELPESSMSNKGVGKWPVTAANEADMPPPPKIKAAGPMDSEVQRRLAEKIEKYWFLWTMMELVEQDHGQPGMFQAGFLNMDDTKATMLEDKIQKQMVSEFSKRWSLKIEVANELRDAMK